ncbi:MAG: hypothetical protein H6744_14025 [Deltaproteobacteria bacterium]|nr:hypothetical protein [Deltaproteobacteria bacterium]MCB9787796.1 hypothetical protein [Deltaproteobacteria bacterium]
MKTVAFEPAVTPKTVAELPVKVQSPQDYEAVARAESSQADEASSQELEREPPERRRRRIDEEPGMAAALAARPDGPGTTPEPRVAARRAEAGAAGTDGLGSPGRGRADGRGEGTGELGSPTPAEAGGSKASGARDAQPTDATPARREGAARDVANTGSGAARGRPGAGPADASAAGSGPAPPGAGAGSDAVVRDASGNPVDLRQPGQGGSAAATAERSAREPAVEAAPVAAARTAATPAEVAQAAPRSELSAVGAVVAKAMRRAIGAVDGPSGEALDDTDPIDGDALVAALSGAASGAAPTGTAAALTPVALSAPQAVARDPAVSDALAQLHMDDDGVAIVRVERTSIGAIEAHLSRHGVDISVRLRAVEAEHQARLLQALPAVRRELDASALVVGRIDVRGDVPADTFGRGGSQQGPGAGEEGAHEPQAASAPDDARPRPRPPQGGSTAQPGDRRRLLLIA